MQNCIQVHICTYTQETYLYNIMLVRAGYCVLVQMYEPPCAAGRGSQEGCPLPLGVKALHHHKNQRTSQVVAVCVCVCACVCVCKCICVCVCTYSNSCVCLSDCIYPYKYIILIKIYYFITIASLAIYCRVSK